MKTIIIVEVIFIDEFTQYNFKLNEKLYFSMKKSNKSKPTSNLRIENIKMAKAMINLEDICGGEQYTSFEYIYYRNEMDYENKISFDCISTKDIDSKFKKYYRKEVQK
jgi:hypothetical protein